MSSLLPKAVVISTCSALQKLKRANDPELFFYFIYGFSRDGNDDDAYLQVKKTKIPKSDLKDLKEKISAQFRSSVIYGHVFFHAQEDAFEFRSKKAAAAQKTWKKSKKTKSLKALKSKLSSTYMNSYLSSGPAKGAKIGEVGPLENIHDFLWKALGCLKPKFPGEYQPENDVDLMDDDLAENQENTPKGLPTTHEYSIQSIANFMLYQQNMFRDETGQVDWTLNAQELKIFDAEGDDIKWNPELLQETGLDSCFSCTEDGALEIAHDYRKPDSISKSKRMQLSTVLSDLLNKGFSFELKHDQKKIHFEADASGNIFEEIISLEMKGGLDLSRRAEMVPDVEPPISFGDLMEKIQRANTLEDVVEGNAVLATQFQLEKANQKIPEDMSFFAYKLQFASLNVPNVDEKGLRWHDGDGDLNIGEWAGLYNRVQDLPEEENHYYWATIEWDVEKPDGEKKREKVTQRLAFPRKESDPEEQKKIAKEVLAKDGWYTDKLDITVSGYSYSLPAQKSLLPLLSNWSAGQMNAFLLDEDGQGGVSSDADIQKQQQQDLAKKIHNTAFLSSMKQCQANLGTAVSSLISGIPDTQKIFLRQSNGVENYDEINGVDLGQTQVITSGNDTGAYGKCAPTSYFCGAICGIANGCQDGFTELKENEYTENLASELEALYTTSPYTQESYAKMDQLIEKMAEYALQDRSNRYLIPAIKKVQQLKESIIDRLQVQEDKEGPFFAMNFALPRIRDGYGSSLRPGVYSVQVRPEDIQEYLEQNNRADGYRGGKKHMMDHFKDPAAMNQLDFLKDLGPGLVAVGVDKALKTAGKDSGLLFGPGPEVVASMVYNRKCSSGYMEVNKPIDAEVNSPEFEKQKKSRNKKMVRMLKQSKESGGGITVSMGYNMGNGHVNYVQDWGTPKIDGVEISSVDLARCHMNKRENSGGSSAWNNDRVQPFPIDLERMAKGLQGIAQQLRKANKNEMARKIEDMAQDAEGAYMSGWGSRDKDVVRKMSADVMEWMKENLVLDNDEPNEGNIVLMPSNTERDDSVSDNNSDRDNVGGGAIGSQARGSANATDGSYFVPMECLAAGWNKAEGEATQYAGFDPSDSFVFLSSLETIQ